MAKWPIKRVATMSPDYAFGQDLTKAFVTHLKKLRPDIEIVDQQWPKLGEADYTPFINAQLAKKPDAVFTSLWGGHFVTFVKQAKPLRYFEAVNFNVMAAGEAGAIETAKAMGDDYPLGITANSYDAFNWDGPPAHKEYIQRLRAYLKDDNPSSWPITGYIGMQMLAAAIAKAGSTDSDKVAKAMLEISVDTPIGKQNFRTKDHQANRAQFWGKMAKDPRYPYAVTTPPRIHRSDPVHGLRAAQCPVADRRPRTEPDAVKSVTKVLDILEYLGRAQRPASVSRHRRAPPASTSSTAFRQLQTLVTRGFAEQAAGHRSYVLGPMIYQLASAYLKGSDLCDARAAAPRSASRCDRRDRLPGHPQPRRDRATVQGRRPERRAVPRCAWPSASPPIARRPGKVLLSGLATDELDRYLSSVKLVAYTPQTITRRARSSVTLALVRAQGYAIDVEEYAENLCCVSVPGARSERRA